MDNESEKAKEPERERQHSKPKPDEDRFWQNATLAMAQKFKGDIKFSQDEYDVIDYLYTTIGGSWESIANGDTEAWALLRKTCKVYIKRKLKAEKDKHDEE